jgi:hypothetical protein
MAADSQLIRFDPDEILTNAMKRRGHAARTAMQHERAGEEERAADAVMRLLPPFPYWCTPGDPTTEERRKWLARWPAGFHEFLLGLWSRRDAAMEQKIEAALRGLRKRCRDGFRVLGRERPLTKTELVAELRFVARQAPKLQVPILKQLDQLWMMEGKLALRGDEALRRVVLPAPQRAMSRRGDAAALAAAEIEAAEERALVDVRGHTAPLEPCPAFLLRCARLKNGRIEKRDVLTWPSVHDVVMGLAMRRKEIMAALAGCKWRTPPTTAPARPGKAVRVRPAALRWLIKKALADAPARPGTMPGEHRPQADFLRTILRALPR